jgi:hypothetical protein
MVAVMKYLRRGASQLLNMPFSGKPR